MHKPNFSCLKEDANINSRRRMSFGAPITPNWSFCSPLGWNKHSPSLNTLLVWGYLPGSECEITACFVLSCFDSEPWALLSEVLPWLYPVQQNTLPIPLEAHLSSGSDQAVSKLQSACRITCTYKWKNHMIALQQSQLKCLSLFFFFFSPRIIYYKHFLFLLR